MGDESVRKELWEGRIPVCFRVAEEEVGMGVSGERVIPEPCYVSTARTPDKVAGK